MFFNNIGEPYRENAQIFYAIIANQDKKVAKFQHMLMIRFLSGDFPAITWLFHLFFVFLPSL